MTQEKYPELNIAVPDGYPQMSADRYRLRFLKNFDYHAGLTETMLVNYEHPELIEKEHIPVNKGELPSNLATIANGDGFDEIDELLAKTLLPSHTTRMTSTGIWGISDVGKYAQVDVKNAMDLFDQFFVRFITKWHSTEEVL